MPVDEMIPTLSAVQVRVLREALKEAAVNGGHDAQCRSAKKGKLPTDCNCWKSRVRAALALTETP